MEERSQGLLEYLRVEVGCSYISDLRLDSYLLQIQEIIRRIEENQFDLEQWSDAVSYITKRKAELRTPQEYKEYLLKL